MTNIACAETNYVEPVFSLEFNINGTGAEVRLNDIPILYHKSSGETTSQKPIPESIVDGVNTLKVRSFPLKKNNREYLAGSYIEAIISVREKDAPLNESKPLLQLKLNPANDELSLLENTISELGSGEAVVLEYDGKRIVAERGVSIKSPFPRWAWQDGQVIEDTPENFDSLLAVYKEIWEALNEGDKARVQALYDPAAQEFAIAYHYQDKKHGHRIMNTGGLINDDDWGLADINVLIDKMRYRLDVFANGKIVKIIDQDKRTPIVYYSKKVKMLNIQKFGFYKNKAGEWVMIR